MPLRWRRGESKAIMMDERDYGARGESVVRGKRLLVLECVTQEECYAGKLTVDFLKETGVKELVYGRLVNKSNLLSDLGRSDFFRRCRYVHIVAHGADGVALTMPRGEIHPSELPKDCFRGRYVTLTACGLSRRAFMDPFRDS